MIPSHEHTPKPGQALLVSNQLAQAQLLGEALVDSPCHKEEEDQSLTDGTPCIGAAEETLGTMNLNPQVILPTTDLTLPVISPPVIPPPVIPPSSNFVEVPGDITGQVVEVFDPTHLKQFKIKRLDTTSEMSVPGGCGLLCIRNSQVTTDSTQENGNVPFGGRLDPVDVYTPFNTALQENLWVKVWRFM